MSVKPYFLFLFLIPLALAYNPGDRLDLSYSNVTNVTFPCELRNNSIYIANNAPTGDLSCNITYWGYESPVTISTGGGGGGGGSHRHKDTTVIQVVNNTPKQVLKPYLNLPKEYPNTDDNNFTNLAPNPEYINDKVINVTEPLPSSVQSQFPVWALAIITLTVILAGLFIFFGSKSD